MIHFPSGFEGVYTHLIVHCAATPASLDEGASWIDRAHRQKGWSRCGYHAVIRRDGTLEWELTGHRTRPIGKPGAHVGGCGPGWNERSLGICLMGGVKEDGKTPENNFTEAQMQTLHDFISAATHAIGIDAANVMGHRDLIKETGAAPKACPCFSVREVMDGWAIGSGLAGYDRVRLPFDWKRDKFPPAPRGDKLKVTKTYTVREGDTLWSISRTYGVRLHDLTRLNPGLTSMIDVGQRIRLLN